MASRRSYFAVSLRTVLAAVVALSLTGKAGGTQTRPERISMNAAVGISGQNRDYRSSFGPAARFGVEGALLPRVHWGLDLGFERFGDGGAVYAPCVDGPCPDMVGAATFVNASALLMLRDDGFAGAYFLGGGGVTRVIPDARSPGSRTYAHVAGGIGWDLRWGRTRPFVEVRFTRYLPGLEPMSGWSMPLLIGIRF